MYPVIFLHADAYQDEAEAEAYLGYNGQEPLDTWVICPSKPQDTIGIPVDPSIILTAEAPSAHRGNERCDGKA